MAKQVQIVRDAVNGRFYLAWVDPSFYSPANPYNSADPSADWLAQDINPGAAQDLPYVVADLYDVAAVGPDVLHVTFRGIHFTDSHDSTNKYVAGLVSQPEADDGTHNNTDDLFLGGAGGAGASEYALQSVSGDYITAWPIVTLVVSSLTSSGTTATLTTSAPHGLANGTVVPLYVYGASPAAYNGIYQGTVTGASTLTYTFAGGTSPATGTITCRLPQATNTSIAKPWKLRASRTTETGADGTVYALTYGTGPNTNNVQRTKTPSGGTAEIEYVSPEWLVNDILYALPATTSILDAAGNPITLILVDTRAWTAS